jgi:hypothetical protein
MIGVLVLGRVETAEKGAKYIYAKMMNVLFVNCSTTATGRLYICSG